MGDYGSPKRKDLYDRLRRRFEQYRRRHQNSTGRHDRVNSNLYEHQRQETLLLQQRWLESKAKKAARNSRSNNNSNVASVGSLNSGGRDAGTLSDRNNSSHISKKRKTEHDHVPTTNTTVDQIYDFPESDDHKAHGTSADTCVRSQVSVNIIQQINTQGDCSGNQTSKIKLTVSSTVHTANNNNNNSNKPSCVTEDSSQLSQTSTVEASVCKQEPQEVTDTAQQSNNPQPNSTQGPASDNFNIGEVGDELEAFLSQLSPGVFKELMDNAGPLSEESDDISSQDLMPSGINKFTEPAASQSQPTCTAPHSVQQQQATKACSGSSNKKTADRKDSHPSTPGGMYGDPLHSANSPNGQYSASSMGYPRPQSGPPGPGTSPGIAPPVPPHLLGDTGPAAETLKQMAAQHQHDFAIKGPTMSPNLPDNRYGGRTGPYPYAYNGGHQANGMYRYGAPNNTAPTTNMPRPDSKPAFPGQTMPKLEPGMDYGGTQPLSHFSEPVASSSSSLEQLQNQVHSQFSKADGSSGGKTNLYQDSTQLHIKQSQFVQMSSNNANMPQSVGQTLSVSQTQQMHVHRGPSPQHITVAQQQTISLPNMSQTNNIAQTPSMAQGPNMAQAPNMAQGSNLTQGTKMAQGNNMAQGPSMAQGPNMVQGPNVSQAHSMLPGQFIADHSGLGQFSETNVMSGNHSNPPHRKYMTHPPSHPPPEYKPPEPGTNFGPPTSVRDSNNPLQTMQNMVNQTSASATAGSLNQDLMYRERIKSELGSGPNGHLIPHQGMSVMPQVSQRSSPVAATGTHPNMAMAGHRQTPTYPMAQQQPNVAGPNMTNGSLPGKTAKSDPPMYTSAIMRGQRPPNVNVGPDGLNISHQRTSGDWPRTMMGPSHLTGMPMPPSYPGGMRPGMAPHNMMPYPNTYQNTGYPGMAVGPGPGMDHHHLQMSQQQAAAVMAHRQRMAAPHSQQHPMMPMGGRMSNPRMAQHHHGPPHQGHMPHGASMMPPGMQVAQHQQMSIQHNGQAISMNQSNITSHPAQGPHQGPQRGPHQGPHQNPHGYHSAPCSGQTDNSVVAQSQQNTRTNPSGPEFALDFLDNPPSSNTEFFDSMVQNSNPSDFNNFIDDILGGGK